MIPTKCNKYDGSYRKGCQLTKLPRPRMYTSGMSLVWSQLASLGALHGRAPHKEMSESRKLVSVLLTTVAPLETFCACPHEVVAGAHSAFKPRWFIQGFIFRWGVDIVGHSI